MNYNRQIIINFAKFVHEYNFLPGDDADYNGLLDTFLDSQDKPNPKPEPEQGICLQVLEAAAEMCGISMNELDNGKKYGQIPSCKQMTAKILHELKCPDGTIASKLPQMGSVGSIRSRREAAARRENSGGEKNYRQVLGQLRSKFNIEIPVI